MQGALCRLFLGLGRPRELLNFLGCSAQEPMPAVLGSKESNLEQPTNQPTWPFLSQVPP